MMQFKLSNISIFIRLCATQNVAGYITNLQVKSEICKCLTDLVNIFATQVQFTIWVCMPSVTSGHPQASKQASDTSYPRYIEFVFHKLQPITGHLNDPDCRSRKKCTVVILSCSSLSAHIDLLALRITFSPTP